MSRTHSKVGAKNSSLITRLPRWMKDASNRKQILAMLAKLRGTIDR